MSDAPVWVFTAAGAISAFVIVAGLLQALLYIVQLVFAALALRDRPTPASSALLWERYAEVAPPIAVIAPAYNEELTIVESVVDDSRQMRLFE